MDLILKKSALSMREGGRVRQLFPEVCQIPLGNNLLLVGAEDANRVEACSPEFSHTLPITII